MSTTEELHKKRIDVIRLSKKNTPIMTIVKKCGLSYPAVRKAIALYDEGGMEALKPPPRGRTLGMGRLLSKNQEENLCSILLWKKPYNYNLNSYYRQSLWNRDIILQLIQNKYGVKLSSRSLGHYLKRCGFPPLPKNYQPISKCHKKIQNLIRDNKEVFDQYPPQAIFWVSKRAIDGKKNKWMLSAIDNHRKEHWKILDGKFTLKEMQKFFLEFHNKVRRPVLVIKRTQESFSALEFQKWLYQRQKKVQLFPQHPTRFKEAEIAVKIEEKKQREWKEMVQASNEFHDKLRGRH